MKKSCMKIPHAVIDPEGLRHEVGNVSVLQSWQRNGQRAYLDCMQTGMHACGSVIPTEAQLSGLERHQNSVIGSRKTVMTVRDEDEKRSKSENPTCFSCGSMSGITPGFFKKIERIYLEIFNFLKSFD